MEIRSIDLVAQAFRPADVPPPRGPEVLVVGRSNVGKSSLINRLLGRRNLARVAKAPGKTRGAFFYSLNRDAMVVVDLPGYGFARVGWRERQSWERLVGRIAEREGPRLLLQLVDLRLPAQAIDQAAAEWFDDRIERRLVVGTKADKLSRGAAASSAARLASAYGRSPLPVSAKTGAGVRQLWRELEESLATGR